MALELETAPLAESPADHAASNGHSTGFDLDDLLNDPESPPFDTNEAASGEGAASEGEAEPVAAVDNDGLPGEVIAGPVAEELPKDGNVVPPAVNLGSIPEPPTTADTTADKPKKDRKKKGGATASGETPAATLDKLFTPTDRSPEIESLLDEINRERMHADAAKAVVVGIKSDLKDARKSHEAAMDRVMELLGQLDRIRNDQNRPLLKKAEAKAATVEKPSEAASEVKPAEPAADVPQTEQPEQPTAAAEQAPDPAPPGTPIGAKPLTVRIVRVVSLVGDEGQADLIINPGREFDCRVDASGNVIVSAQDSSGVNADVELEPEDFEVVTWEGQPSPGAAVPTAASGDPSATTRDPETNLSWRSVRLADLLMPAIPPGCLKSLEAAHVETMGQLADYPKKEGVQITAIKGIGEGKLAKIEEATTAFWRRWGKGGDC